MIFITLIIITNKVRKDNINLRYLEIFLIYKAISSISSTKMSVFHVVSFNRSAPGFIPEPAFENEFLSLN
jgi:hypothetical protein